MNKMDASDSHAVLLDNYRWRLTGQWSAHELGSILDTAMKIEAWVESLLPGSGLVWMRRFLGGVTLRHTDSAPAYVSRKRDSALPPLISGSLQRTIYIIPDPHAATGHLRWLAHELGHAWDMKTGFLTPFGIQGGVADLLNEAIGGRIRRQPFACRFCDHSGLKHIPPAALWEPAGSYGNNSTADYLAETFAWLVLGGRRLPPGVKDWVEARIRSSAL
jgi:hypothetical protein